jgi:hypothetical protein
MKGPFSIWTTSSTAAWHLTNCSTNLSIESKNNTSTYNQKYGGCTCIHRVATLELGQKSLTFQKIQKFPDFE